VTNNWYHHRIITHSNAPNDLIIVLTHFLGVDFDWLRLQGIHLATLFQKYFDTLLLELFLLLSLDLGDFLGTGNLMLLRLSHFLDIGGSLTGLPFKFRIGRVEGWDILDHLLASLVSVVKLFLVAASIADCHEVLLLDVEGALRDLTFTAQDVLCNKPN
jgi:hypothetical protein